MTENEIGKIVVDTALAVHRELGPGLLESVYEIVLAYELQQRGLHVNRQVPIPIRYKDMIFNEAFRGDLVIEEKVILELKSVEQRVRLIRTGSNITTVNRMQTGFLAQLR
jgi:GxxExxY protein